MNASDSEWFELYDDRTDNRRRARRVNRTVPIRYVGCGGGVQSSVALNVSLTGARVILRGRDGPQELTLKLDTGPDVLARTVWEQPVGNGHCRIAGVVFESVGPGQQAALQRFLEQLEAA